MKHWNSYWLTTKTLNSFAEGKHSDGYIDEIADIWNEIFITFPNSATILDLATGNGALAVLANKFNGNFKITASDAANINPLSVHNLSEQNYQLLEKIDFKSNTPSENLAFETGKFDRVISQFGFEYADAQKAMTEVMRVLRPNGQFIGMIHHQDSFISKDCLVGLEIIDLLKKKNGLIIELQNFGNFCQTIINKAEPTLEQQSQFKAKNTLLLKLFKGIQSQCSNEAELSWCNLLLKEFLPIVMDWQRTDSIRVNNIRENLDLFELRLKDQQNAAMSKFDTENIKKIATANEFNCEIDEIYHEAEILCWKIKVLK